MDQQRSDRDKGTFERLGEDLGGAAGRAAGRGTDMAAGMAGSLLGSAVNTLGEWWASPEARRAEASFGEREDRSCRAHFESRGEPASSRSYDEVRPLYQFGHMAGQNPDYHGREFDDVEPDLQRAWEQEPRREQGDWPEVRGYVGFGYEAGEDMPRDI